MEKLRSFKEFSTIKAERTAAAIQEEQDAKRNNEANTFKSLLSEYGVGAIKELSEEQRAEFFEKLRGSEVNESNSLIIEGTRGQFGIIDKKGNITSVYTHYDSYPENMLPLIKKHYKDANKVKDVIVKGDSSGLDAFDKMSFYVDRGDVTTPTTGKKSDIARYLNDIKNDAWAEYVYLYDESDKKWYMADTYADRELKPAFESAAIESVIEAVVVMDAVDPKSKGLKKLLKKHNVKMKILTMDGPGGGWPEVEMEGSKEDLIAVLSDSEYGWDDPELAEYIEERNSNHIIKTHRINEAIQVQYKRDAKKVLTQYNRIFNKTLIDFGAMDKSSLLGCIKYLANEALQDANFHREAEATRFIKGNIQALEIKMPGLGGHFVKIGGVTIKNILDKYYSDIANAAGWSGIGIVEGTALYLEQLKEEAMGQAMIDEFNKSFEGKAVRTTSSKNNKVNEAEIKSDEEFKEYAYSVLKKAFGEDFDQAKADDVVNGILGKADGDYGKAAGILQSSLS